MSFSEVLTKFFPKEEDKKLHSKEIAKERLRLVLVQDRGNSLPEDMLLQLRAELINLISRYMVIDEGQLDMAFNKSPGGQHSGGAYQKGMNAKWRNNLGS